MLGSRRRFVTADCSLMAQRTDSRYDAEPWVLRLQTSIVKQAVSDLRSAVRADKTATVAALDKWFRSEWGQLLCLGSGEYIAEKVKKEEAKKEETERHERRFHY